MSVPGEGAMSDRALSRAMAKAVARAWRDPDYAERLRVDPSAALAEIGAEIPDDVTLVVHDEHQSVLVLPSPDAPDADAALARAAEAALAEFARATAAAAPPAPAAASDADRG